MSFKKYIIKFKKNVINRGKLYFYLELTISTLLVIAWKSIDDTIIMGLAAGSLFIYINAFFRFFLAKLEDELNPRFLRRYEVIILPIMSICCFSIVYLIFRNTYFATFRIFAIS